MGIWWRSTPNGDLLKHDFAAIGHIPRQQHEVFIASAAKGFTLRK
jgi:hypothetical protein